MSAVLANPTEMIRQGAPRLIHTDEELAEYTSTLFELTAKPNPTPDEEEAIELMTLLVERYEQEHTRFQRRSLPKCCASVGAKWTSQRDIAPELGQRKHRFTGSFRQTALNRDHIARLSSGSMCRRRFSLGSFAVA